MALHLFPRLSNLSCLHVGNFLPLSQSKVTLHPPGISFQKPLDFPLLNHVLGTWEWKRMWKSSSEDRRANRDPETPSFVSRTHLLLEVTWLIALFRVYFLESLFTNHTDYFRGIRNRETCCPWLLYSQAILAHSAFYYDIIVTVTK